MSHTLISPRRLNRGITTRLPRTIRGECLKRTRRFTHHPPAPSGVDPAHLYSRSSTLARRWLPWQRPLRLLSRVHRPLVRRHEHPLRWIQAWSVSAIPAPSDRESPGTSRYPAVTKDWVYKSSSSRKRLQVVHRPRVQLPLEPIEGALKRQSGYQGARCRSNPE